ncbi:hypothetical protein [uncultured Eubacterium sp.]|uniref:hypothetical protein n=1 Tax=uncultured Eubacterium sp. TaxID=165185 RepID=UPI0025CBB6E5|nr:hypothetical protein [uncultured Eubacterium sp.]
MICKFCGEEIDDDSVICNNCGGLVKEPKKSNSVKIKTDDTTFYPNKLLLATLFGIVALSVCLFMPCFLGLIPAVIGKKMATELQSNYCQKDCKRAIILCKIAIVINLIVGFFILLIVLANIQKFVQLYDFIFGNNNYQGVAYGLFKV